MNTVDHLPFESYRKYEKPTPVGRRTLNILSLGLRTNAVYSFFIICWKHFQRGAHSFSYFWKRNDSSLFNCITLRSFNQKTLKLSACKKKRHYLITLAHWVVLYCLNNIQMFSHFLHWTLTILCQQDMLKYYFIIRTIQGRTQRHT